MIFNEKEFQQYLETLCIKPGSKVELNSIPCDAEHPFADKEGGEAHLSLLHEQLDTMQKILYADNRHNMLVILQAMDAAGKDGAIKNVAGAFNPVGLHVSSFKKPTTEELEHDYLWRHAKALPPKGSIGFWNRSHYENVLVTRVHPEYLLLENLPDVRTPEDADDDFWQMRLKQINRFEKNLQQNGTVVLKFFLHVSYEEQGKRLLERIDDPAKNWKFNLQDLEERALRKKYLKAYEAAIEATSTEEAPWYILPADDKWFTRLCLSAVLLKEFRKMKIGFPEANPELREQLEKGRKLLTEIKKG